MPQLESASTAAIRATRLEVILPRPLQRAMADVVCFSSAVRIWRQYCRPHVASKLQAEQAHPLRRAAAVPCIDLSSLYLLPPTSAFRGILGGARGHDGWRQKRDHYWGTDGWVE